MTSSPVTVCSGVAPDNAPPHSIHHLQPRNTMAPQLTLQAPLELPPQDVADYLGRLWSGDQDHANGAATFSLLVWQPSWICLLYTSPSPRDRQKSRMPSSA